MSSSSTTEAESNAGSLLISHRLRANDLQNMAHRSISSVCWRWPVEGALWIEFCQNVQIPFRTDYATQVAAHTIARQELYPSSICRVVRAPIRECEGITFLHQQLGLTRPRDTSDAKVDVTKFPYS